MRKDQRLVFVGGLHRSGTTPLARLLAQHPDVSGLRATGVSEDEGQHLQGVYKPANAYGGMGRFANSSRAHLTEHSDLVSTENAARLLDAWQPFWDMNCKYLVEKSPPNLIMTRFLQALFPDAFFVMVMRHPVVVALAMQKWNPRIVSRRGRPHEFLSSMIAHWIRAHEILRDDASHIQRLVVLRYEDLVDAPDAELAKVQSLLGLPTPISSEGLVGGRNLDYELEWRRMADRNIVARRYRRWMDSRFGPAVERFGYDMTDLTRRPESRAF